MKVTVASITIEALSAIGGTPLDAPLDATECSLPGSVVAGDITAETILSLIVIITTILANVWGIRSSRNALKGAKASSQSPAQRTLRTLCIASFLLGISLYLVMIDITRLTLEDWLRLIPSFEGLRYLGLLVCIGLLASPIFEEPICPRTRMRGVALLAIMTILAAGGWATAYVMLIARTEITLHLLTWENMQIVIATLLVVTLVTALAAIALRRFADAILVDSGRETIAQRFGFARFIGLFAVFLCTITISRVIAGWLINTPSPIDLEPAYGENTCNIRTAKYNSLLLATEETCHGSDGHATEQYTFHYGLDRRVDSYVCRNPIDQSVVSVAVSDCPQPSQLVARLLEMKNPAGLEYRQLKDDCEDTIAFVGDDGLVYVDEYARTDGVDYIACVHTYHTDGSFQSRIEYTARAVGEDKAEYYEARQYDENGNLLFYYTEEDKGADGRVTWHNADGSIAAF